MKILLLLAALIQQAAAPAPASFDDFSVNQMMRLATLSPARLAEGRCAGFARWQLAAQPGAALPAESVERLSRSVGDAIANDSGLNPAQGLAIVEVYRADYAESAAALGKEELAEDSAGKAKSCAQLFDGAKRGHISLHPLADATLVDPALASCYGQFKAAADESAGADTEAMERDAALAAELALKGKSQKARKAALAALALEVEAARQAPEEATSEAAMMRLVMCQPLLHPNPAEGTSK